VTLREVLYKVSQGYVALALVYLFALRVCGFTSSVVQGKSMVCGSSTCELGALRVCGFTSGVMVSLES